VPVDGSDPDPGPAGDVVHLGLAALLAEDGARGGHDALAIAAGVGALRALGEFGHQRQM
jgi:hypothetical protein